MLPLWMLDFEHSNEKSSHLYRPAGILWSPWPACLAVTLAANWKSHNFSVIYSWSKVRHHTIRWAGKTQQGGFHLDKSRSSQPLVFRVKHPELQAHWSSLSLYLKYPEPAIFEKDESHYIRVFQHQSVMTCARRLPGLYHMILQLKTGGRLQ